ncbi:hypothetical protein CSV79_09805 [Sporosarcina sp. P13]|nr:hypothetical protein CSV79_09805 [Sporosarcina sp. P13]
MKGGFIIKQDERGMTLVETLATLLLVTLVVSLIWTTFFISSRHNVMETHKLRLQQDGNYITAEIQRLHRICDEYELVITANKVSVENCDSDKPNTPKNYTITKEYIYSLEEQEPTTEEVRYSILRSNKDLYISEFKITDPRETKWNITFPLMASRYKKSS